MATPTAVRPTARGDPAVEGSTPAPGRKPPDTERQELSGRRGDVLLLAVLALMITACLPFLRVYIGLDFLRPVLAAALLSVGLAWACRRAGAGPLTALAASLVGWAVLSAVAFLPDTLAFGVLPTFDSIGAGRDLWLRGIELIRLRPSPAFAEAGMLFITVTGVWWVAHAVEGLVFRLQAPLRAIVMALVLWSVPLAVAAPGQRVWIWAVPLLAAAAAVLLVFSGADLDRWGSRVAPDGHGLETGDDAWLVSSGWPVALCAIVAGAVLGGSLPGFDDPPWWEVRGLGGTTLTTNPIVSIRPSLVNQSDEVLAQVTTPQPVYLRLTALDVYDGQTEEWTNAGIRGGDASGSLPLETDIQFARTVDVNITADGLEGAVIVPTPYHPVAISGDLDDRLQFDSARATFTLDQGETVLSGDAYQVTAAIPAPPVEQLRASSIAGVDPALAALPESVPEEVRGLAADIVAAAGAETPFDQALAIQNELRTWEYSLAPPAGHGASAMEAFIDSRVGYCEQFAGTMAVMLRSLGIPARVAVGFTPGETLGPSQYAVTGANAHAWVEVLFPGLGWISFEPTPRSDGNVLVPSSANLSPTSTIAQQLTIPDDGSLSIEDEQEMLERQSQLGGAPLPENGVGSDVPAAGAEGGGGLARVLLVLLVLLAVVILVPGVALLLLRGPRTSGLVPAELVLREVARVHAIGSGAGRAPRPSETDAEYLRRLVPGSPSAADLAGAAERARYAPLVPADQAQAATRAADTVVAEVLASRTGMERLLVRVRALLAPLVTAVRSRVQVTTDLVGGLATRDRIARLTARRRSRP